MRYDLAIAALCAALAAVAISGRPAAANNNATSPGRFALLGRDGRILRIDTENGTAHILIAPPPGTVGSKVPWSWKRIEEQP